MSTHFRLEKSTTMRAVFGGRLARHGITEEVVPNETSAKRRALVDQKRNYLWIYSDDDGCVQALVRYGGTSPIAILEAISAEFDTEINSEHDFRYWGYDSQEEWDAFQQKMAAEARDPFYQNVVNFVTGKEPHDLRPGTIGMHQAEIAKALALANPDLLLPQNKDEFLKAIHEGYELKHPPVMVDLSEGDIQLARAISQGVTWN